MVLGNSPNLPPCFVPKPACAFGRCFSDNSRAVKVVEQRQKGGGRNEMRVVFGILVLVQLTLCLGMVQSIND